MNHSDMKRMDWIQDQLAGDGCAGASLTFDSLPTGSVRVGIIPAIKPADENEPPQCYVGKTVRSAIDAAMKAAAE